MNEGVLNKKTNRYRRKARIIMATCNKYFPIGLDILGEGRTQYIICKIDRLNTSHVNMYDLNREIDKATLWDESKAKLLQISSRNIVRDFNRV